MLPWLLFTAVWLLVWAPFLIVCCCTDECHPGVCVLTRTCTNAIYAGVPVTFTGPGGFTGSGTSDGTGTVCVEVPGPGTYVGHALNRTVSIVVGDDCDLHYGTIRDGNATRCVTIKKCSTVGPPMTGLTVRITQVIGGVTVTKTGTTGSDGKVCFCVENSISTVVYVDSPPCPYTATSWTLGPFAGTLSNTTLVPNFNTTDYFCCGNTYLVPTGGYTISWPCGPTSSALSGCVSATSDKVGMWQYLVCPDFPITYLDRKTDTTGFGYVLSCGSIFGAPAGWTLKIIWSVLVFQKACSPAPTWGVLFPYDSGSPVCTGPILDQTGTYRPTTGVIGNVYSFEYDVPLTGTNAEGNINLTGTIPSTVTIEAEDNLAVPTPCPGTVTITRTWCGLVPDLG